MVSGDVTNATEQFITVGGMSPMYSGDVESNIVISHMCVMPLHVNIHVPNCITNNSLSWPHTLKTQLWFITDLGVVTGINLVISITLQLQGCSFSVNSHVLCE